MTLRQHIWNYFVSSKRLEEAWTEAELPNSGLQIHLTVIRRNYPNNYHEVLNTLSEFSITKSPSKTSSELKEKVRNLINEEDFCDALLRPKIGIQKVNNLMRKFSNINCISSCKRCGDTVWTVPTKFYDIEIEFEKFGKYKGLCYSLNVFPKDEKRGYSTCLFYFCCESLMGYGPG